MSNEFSNRIFDGCPYPSVADCVLYNGNFILSQNNVKVNDFTDTWVILFAMIIVYHLIALCALIFIPQPPSGSVGLSSEDADTAAEADTEFENEGIDLKDISLKYKKLETIEEEGVHGVQITLKNIQLSVSVPTQNIFNQSVEKKLLKDISTTIEAGKLVGLMGGSGSGKTTLMNLIAGRLAMKKASNRFSSYLNSDANYIGSGSILFNGAVANGEQLRQMIGYVQQVLLLFLSAHYQLTNVIITITRMIFIFHR